MHDQEQNILKLLKDENKQGLKEMFDFLYSPLCLYSQKIVGRMDIAEDVVQNVFVSFWENKNYLKVKSGLSSYLYSSVRNRSLNYVRSNKIKTTEWLSEYESIYSELNEKGHIQEELIKKIEEAIETLPPGGRKIFKSIVIEGLSYKNAAEVHNVSINTVKSQLKRATRLLSEKLDNLSFILVMDLFFRIISNY